MNRDLLEFRQHLVGVVNNLRNENIENRERRDRVNMLIYKIEDMIEHINYVLGIDDVPPPPPRLIRQ